MPHFAAVRECRSLSGPELALIRWLLENGEPEARPFLDQLRQAKVHARCSCGCSSIDLAIDGVRCSRSELHILSDYQWRSPLGHRYGAFVFEQGGLLAGLDLWSMDGRSIPRGLPSIGELEPQETLR